MQGQCSAPNQLNSNLKLQCPDGYAIGTMGPGGEPRKVEGGTAFQELRARTSSPERESGTGMWCSLGGVSVHSYTREQTSCQVPVGTWKAPRRRDAYTRIQMALLGKKWFSRQKEPCDQRAGDTKAHVLFREAKASSVAASISGS